MPQAINSWISGGFPHSEIRGSKGALPSPRLIAECHVLHRLLSPRHSPNALIALDPIQKTKDHRSPFLDQVILIRCWISPTPRSVHRLGKTAFACPPHCLHHPGANPRMTQTRRAPPSPHAGKTNKSVSCFSLFTMSKTIKVQTNIKTNALKDVTTTSPNQIPVGRCPRAARY